MRRIKDERGRGDQGQRRERDRGRPAGRSGTIVATLGGSVLDEVTPNAHRKTRMGRVQGLNGVVVCEARLAVKSPTPEVRVNVTEAGHCENGASARAR